MYCNVIQIEILLAQELNFDNGKSCGFRLVGPHFCDLICVHKMLFYQESEIPSVLCY